MPTGSRLAASLLGATDGASFDDSGATNTVLAVVAVLVVIGILVLGFTWWFWRSTKPEPEALAPLELLGTRKIRKTDSDGRRRALDAVRPTSPATTAPAAAEPVDLAALAARDLPPISELQESDLQESERYEPDLQESDPAGT